MALCLCGCGLKARFRGLCDKQYQRYRRAVLARETTWSELASQGKCLRKQKHGNFGFAPRKKRAPLGLRDGRVRW